MDSQPQYNKIIELLKNRFADELKAIILFGSRARGDFHSQSDHDILLIIDNLSIEPISRMRELRTTLIDSDIHINIVAVTPNEFTKDITPLILDICMDGDILFGHDFFEPLRSKVKKYIKDAGLTRRNNPPKGEWELTWEGFHEFKK